MSQKLKLMLIDGHSLAFRAFYAVPLENFYNSQGQYTNAVHGFLSMLIRLLENERPDAIAVAFDRSRVSFRTEEYPEYKGNREKTPEEFAPQVALIRQALDAFKIQHFDLERYEADDIIASFAAKAAGEGHEVLVVSGDRDMIQVINDQVTLLYPSARGMGEMKRYTEETVLERYGIYPQQYPEIAALVGETSDNLPGVYGVGEKTAVKWIQQYGSLEALIEHRDEIRGKIGERLREQYHLAERNRRLNRLVTELDMGVEIEDLRFGQVPIQEVAELFAELEFRSLLRRVEKFSGQKAKPVDITSDKRRQKASAPKPPTGPTSHLPIDLPEKPEIIPLAIDDFTEWLSRRENPTLVCSIFTDWKNVVSMPVELGATDGKERVESVWVFGSSEAAAFESWLASDCAKTLWDAKTLMRICSRYGLIIGGVSDDVLVADWMVSPNTPSKDLATAIKEYFGVEVRTKPDPEQLVQEHPVVPSEIAWCIHFMREYTQEVLPEKTAQVYRQIEIPLISVLAKLEDRGVQIDTAILQEQLGELTAAAQEHEQAAFRAIGRELNLASPKQVSEVLFGELNMPRSRKTKNGYSTNAAVLAELQATNSHPFLDGLLAWRDVTKLKQIIEGLTKAVQEDGRIHTRFLQTAASTGRLSSADPNLQNIPVRSETGKKIRSAFVFGSEYENLLTADYSQIEMRIMAHMSGDEALIAAFCEGEDMHRFVGSQIFSVRPEDVTSEMRTKVKAMSYGLVYGLSAFGLSKQLGISLDEAKEMMKTYFARFGQVRDFLRSIVEQAKETGYTETLFGRRRFFPEFKHPNHVVRANAERAALNAPIQGTAADVIKIAMNTIEQRMREEGMRSRMILQIHDELVFEVAAGEQEVLQELVTKQMSAAAQLRVPLDVAVGIGANWNQAAH